MKERIQQFIRVKSLSSARFADLLNVQRSSISHILTGRNKPSMDFMEKFLNAFPEVNAEWLITGSGKMLKGNDSINISPEKEEKEIPIPANPIQEPKNLFQEPIKVEKIEAVKEDVMTKEADIIQSNITKEERKEAEPVARTAVPTQEKGIDRIVIFYTDGSFSSYTPQ